MKQAKWLLLVAVGILMVLPGCKSMNPAATPDVRIADYTQPLGTWTLHAGKVQTPCGEVTMYWRYDSYDETKTGNDAFANLELVIKFTTDPGWPINGDAHVDASTTLPTTKGAPGQYNLNRYQQPYGTNTNTRIFVIPVAALATIPWRCGDWLYFRFHCSAGPETAMAGIFVSTGTGPNAWFNYVYMQLINPDPPDHPQEPGYDEETAWGYNITDPAYWFWAVTGPKFKWGGAIPYTLGTGPVVVDLWAGAGRNQAPPGIDVGSVTITDDVGASGGNVYVTYTPISGVMLAETHAGADPTLLAMYQRTNFAPGQLGVNHLFDPWVPSDQIVLTYNPNWGTSFVVAAHAVVEIPEATPGLTTQ